MIDEIDFAKQDGLVPAIVQDYQTGEVLMLAYMNAEALNETILTGRACYFSRSKNRLWRKGEESGNVQLVHALYTDCDHDTILLKVEQVGGAACHTGHRSCFYLRHADGALIAEGQRLFDPSEVYKK